MPLQGACRRVTDPAGEAVDLLERQLDGARVRPAERVLRLHLEASACPVPADVFGVSFAVHVVELAFVIVTVR